MYSAKDCRLLVTVPGVVHDHEVQNHSDVTVDHGDSATQVMSSGGVAYVADGNAKPSISFNVVSGHEAARLRALCVHTDGKKRGNVRLSVAFRRDGHSLVLRFGGCMLGEGGGVKVGNEGVQSDKAIKFLAKVVQQSLDGAPFRRVS